MSLAGARPLNPALWLGLPMLQALVLTVLFAVPFRVFGLQLPEPIFALAPAFAWAVIRPSILAPFGILAMGLFLDLFWGGPMGLWALSLLTGYGAMLAGRTLIVGQSRLMMWIWYGTACALTQLAAYLFTMADVGAMPSLVSVGWQFLATAILFPFADRLIDRFEDADVRFR